MKRIEWIDSLKGFGILCVSLGHLNCGLLLDRYIYSFHMFLFFFISGFLHKGTQKDFADFFIKKTKALFIPFMFWNVASLVTSFAFNISFAEAIRRFFVLDGEVCWNTPIWFLLLLYMVEVAFFCIDSYIPKGRILALPLLFLIWLCLPEKNIVLKLNILPVCLLFYTFGNTFKDFSEVIFRENSKKKRLSFGALLLCISVVFGTLLNRRVSFNGANFGNVLYCTLAAVSGVLFYVMIFKEFPVLGKNKVLEYVGRNSLIIMASQNWVIAVFNILLENFLGVSLWQERSAAKAFMLALILAIINIVLVCAGVEAMKKISEKCLAVKKMCIWSGMNIK